MNRWYRRSRRGMTLMETMVSLFVILVMTTMVFQTLGNAIEMNRILEDKDVTTRSARVALSKLRREMQLAFLTPNRTAINTYQTVFVGMDEEPDTLFFTTLAHQRVYMNSRECDQAEITIFGESNPDGPGYILYHRESERIDEEPDEGGRVLPLAYNVRSFGLRYLDSLTNEWKDEWDTRSSDTPYRLPRAVEVSLVLIGPDPDDEDRTVDVPFLTTVLLEYAPRLINPNDPMSVSLAQGNYGGSGGFGGAGAGGLGTGFGAMMGGLQGGAAGGASGGRGAAPNRSGGPRTSSGGGRANVPGMSTRLGGR